MLSEQLVIRDLGLRAYAPTWQKMQRFTDERNESTMDEIWFLEHESVFTQGQAGKAEHLLSTGDIPVVQVDRGGQVTYHGPGQLVIYLLLNLRRKKIGIRDLVSIMEASIVDTLQQYNIEAYAKPDAPGVYVNHNKIASLGLRVRKGCTFHGLALNLDMNLEPFQRINPCGYAGLAMTQLAALTDNFQPTAVAEYLLKQLVNKLGYTELTRLNSLD